MHRFFGLVTAISLVMRFFLYFCLNMLCLQINAQYNNRRIWHEQANLTLAIVVNSIIYDAHTFVNDFALAALMIWI